MKSSSIIRPDAFSECPRIISSEPTLPNARLCRFRLRRVIASRGFWWYMDPPATPPLILDPVFPRSCWRVAALACELGLSVRSLQRLVADSIGIPCKSWLRDLRIVHARKRLRSVDKIGAVVVELGFRSHSEFSREFRTMMGVSPYTFRRTEISRFRATRN